MEAVLQEHLSSGNFYEASQVLRTQIARKQARKKTKDAISIAVSGCRALLEHGQAQSANDVGQLLMELYTDAELPESGENLEPILEICRGFPEDAVVAQATLVKAAIKWSVKCGEYARGHPALHNIAAESYARAEMYDKAQNHFLNGDQPRAFAKMLIQWSSKGYRSEYDLFLARAVLGYLALKNLRDANVLYESVCESVVEPTPMHNFLRFLLLVLERDALPLFQDLRRRYDTTLGRDPNLQMYLDAVGTAFYNLQPAQSGMGGMMGEMMKNLLGGN